MKYFHLMFLLVLPVLLSLPWACNSNNPVSSAPVTVILQQPSSSNPTPTATSAPTTFIIWQNGTAGCYQGNCLINQVFVGFSGTTQVTGNALEWDSDSTNCNTSANGGISNPVDATAYANGHLQLDLKPGLNPSSYTYITVGCGVPYSVNLALLSTSSFTHVSVPLDLTTVNPNLSLWSGLAIQITLNCSGGNFPASGPLLYINNVEWTSN